MRLTVIGCSGSFPTPASAASCYLVEHDGTRILLDLGSGALGPLAAHCDLRSLDGVLLSHLHPDHCLDLTGLYVALGYHPDGQPARRLAVHGPSGTDRRIGDAYRAGPSDLRDPLGRVYEFHDPQEVLRIGPFTFTRARVSHPVEAYAIRVEADGRSLVYSGDTGPDAGLVDLARGADVALFEASFLSGGDNPPDLHLTAAQAAEHAMAAEVPRLILTHLVTWNDPEQSLAEARGAHSGEVSLAAPGMVVQI